MGPLLVPIGSLVTALIAEWTTGGQHCSEPDDAYGIAPALAIPLVLGGAELTALDVTAMGGLILVMGKTAVDVLSIPEPIAYETQWEPDSLRWTGGIELVLDNLGKWGIRISAPCAWVLSADTLLMKLTQCFDEAIAKSQPTISTSERKGLLSRAIETARRRVQLLKGSRPASRKLAEAIKRRDELLGLQKTASIEKQLGAVQSQIKTLQWLENSIPTVFLVEFFLAAAELISQVLGALPGGEEVRRGLEQFTEALAACWSGLKFRFGRRIMPGLSKFFTAMLAGLRHLVGRPARTITLATITAVVVDSIQDAAQGEPELQTLIKSVTWLVSAVGGWSPQAPSSPRSTPTPHPTTSGPPPVPASPSPIYMVNVQLDGSARQATLTNAETKAKVHLRPGIAQAVGEGSYTVIADGTPYGDPTDLGPWRGTATPTFHLDCQTSGSRSCTWTVELPGGQVDHVATLLPQAPL